MTKTTIFISLAAFSVLMSSCVTSKITVKSEPSESDVIVRAVGSEDRTPIGKTPLTISFREIQEKAKVDPSSGEFFELLIERKDHQSERFLIPSARMGHTETIVLAKLKSGETEGRLVHRLLQHLFNAQKLANEREFERAQIELDKALGLDENFTRAMSLRGSIFFVQKRYEESLKWFQKALEVDPQFDDAIKMIAQIKKITNAPETTRGTASEEGAQ